MKLKILSVLMSAVVITGGIAASTAQSNIVDSMEFQGSPIELTIDKAIEIGLKDNVSLLKTELDIEKANSDAQQLKDQARAKRHASGGTSPGTSAYIYGQYYDIQADFTEENAKRNYDIAVTSLKAEIEQSYFGLLNAEQSMQISKENMEVSKDLYDKTRKKFELGMVAKQELLNSELSFLTAETTYKASENTLKNAKMSFNLKLNQEVMTEVKIKDTPKYSQYQLPGIADSISKAFSNRAELKAAQYRVDTNKLKLDAIEKQSSDVSHDYREQKVAYEQAVKDLEISYKTIEMEIRSNYMDVIQKQQEIKSGQKSVELAEESLKLTRATYDVGMSLLTDVQKAQASLLQAKLGLSKAVLDYNLAVRKFEDNLGLGRTRTSS